MRLLVVTEFNPTSPGGGPAVVRQMLEGFRDAANELYWWSCRGQEKQFQNFSVDGLAGFPIPRKLVPAKKLTVLKSKILSGIWAKLATQNLHRTVDRVRPDCIWVIPHNWSIFPAYQYLLGRADPKHRFHTTIQDYPDVHGNERRWGRTLTRRMSEQQLELYAHAATRDATSLPMITELEQKTGTGAAQMLHEGLESEDFEYLHKVAESPRDERVINIAHVGTILMEDQFATVVDSLKRLRDGGRDIRLHFWSAHNYCQRRWFDPVWMFGRGHLEHRAMIEGLKSCEWGLAVMSDQDKDARYNKFSFPTRCISYMAAGLPSIVWGLPDSAVALMTENAGIGMVLGTPQNGRLTDLLHEVLRNDNRIKLRAEIAKTAEHYFDARKMRNKLWHCLTFGGVGAGRNRQTHTTSA